MTDRKEKLLYMGVPVEELSREKLLEVVYFQSFQIKLLREVSRTAEKFLMLCAQKAPT